MGYLNAFKILAVLFATSATQLNTVSIYVNGEKVTDGVIVNGTTYAPVRALADSMDATLTRAKDSIYIVQASRLGFDEQSPPMRLDGIEFSKLGNFFFDYDDKLPSWAPSLKTLEETAKNSFERNKLGRNCKLSGNKEIRSGHLAVTFVGNWSDFNFSGSTSLFVFENVQLKNGTFSMVPTYSLQLPITLSRDDPGGFQEALENIVESFAEYWNEANDR